MTDREYMALALEQARKAAENDEVPVGAVLVCRGRIVAHAGNAREKDKCATHHAELLCIEEGCAVLGGWRLPESTLYVTLEPCPMCAGAIINARICRVVYGASDPKAGAFGSKTDLTALGFNHTPIITRGVMEEECAAVLTSYFKAKRSRQKAMRAQEHLSQQTEETD